MKFSFGSSFAAAPAVLAPVVMLDAAQLRESEAEEPIVLADRVQLAALTVEIPKIDVPALLAACELAPTSVLALRVDLDCPGFYFHETLLSLELPRSRSFSLGREKVADIPRSVVVQGFSVKVSLVATRPVPSGLRGCAIKGGVLSSWEARVPPRNRASMFPVQDSVEPALWRLEIDVDEPEDLDRPVRAALRLLVDSSRFEHLLGNAADQVVREQAIRWLQAETFTSLVHHVLANDALRDHVAAWLSMKTPIEKSLDPKSVGYFVVRVMRGIGENDLSELQRRMTSQPVETTKRIRSRMAIDVAPKGRRKTTQRADS